MRCFSVIFARTATGHFGLSGGGVPWKHCPDDMRHFASVTKGGALVMGRVTAESIHAAGKFPLPGRHMFVVSRTQKSVAGTPVWPDLGAALEAAFDTGRPVFVIGGTDVLRECFCGNIPLVPGRAEFCMGRVYETIIVEETVREDTVRFTDPVPMDFRMTASDARDGCTMRVWTSGSTSASVDDQYTGLLTHIFGVGQPRADRTGTGTLAVFAPTPLVFDLQDAFPLLQLKRTAFRVLAVELLWFLQGHTDVGWLQERNVHIWDDDAAKFAARRPDMDGLGPLYGFQWRHAGAHYDADDLATMSVADYNRKHGGVDQIGRLIEGIRTDPHSRRHLVSAWAVADLDDMALPPCHVMFQMFVGVDGGLSCQMSQRSADVGLGLPFNVASYALLTHIIARATGLWPDRLTVTLGDAHVYKNHVVPLQQMMHDSDPKLRSRVSPPPRLVVEDFGGDLAALTLDHMLLTHNSPACTMKLPLST